MIAAPVRVSSSEGNQRPRPAGLWLRPPAALTLGPASPVRPRIVESTDGPLARLLTHFADEFELPPVPPSPIDSELPGAIPWAERRLTDRVLVRPGSRTEIRRWGAPGTAEMADALLDVTASGVGVRLLTPVRPGERLDVTLWGPGAAWCGRGLGIVRWAVIGECGKALAGLQLSRRLTAHAVRELCASPPSARPECTE